MRASSCTRCARSSSVISDMVRPPSTRLVTTKCDGRPGRHRRQMRDANHLPPPREARHLFAHHHRRFASDVGVNFVEDQHRDFVLRRQHRFERQHDARHLAR